MSCPIPNILLAESVETFRDLLENAEDSPWHIIALANDRVETENRNDIGCGGR
ncbi:MAG: hypothetical protein H6937_05135 [Burkholderiales bacterium]|nr:hypothetical protein [Burkholderiales bacterium]